MLNYRKPIPSFDTEGFIQYDLTFLCGKGKYSMSINTAIVGIGGNSLVVDRQHQSIPDQWLAIKKTCENIADLIEEGINPVITHGNGPQVGFAVLRSEAGKKLEGLHTDPLDVCVASTQATIGYMIQQALQSELYKRNIEKSICVVVTRVLVDEDDPAFTNPTKPIGPFYTREEAEAKIKEFGWVMKKDANRGWRRFVPSPKPIGILEIDVIKTLFERGNIVVAVGGGGIPVIQDEDGNYFGVEAVIDKDFATSLLASLLGVKTMIISTAVEFVYLNFGKENQKPLRRLTVSEAVTYLNRSEFAEGSMAPKIQASIEFLQRDGERVIITNPQNLLSAVRGKTGTIILKS